MDATEFEVRKEELLDECEVAPQVFDHVMPRLERFMKSFVDSLIRREQIEHANTFVQGLLSDLKRKNAESIAYRFGQKCMPLQWFLGVSPWDDKPLRDELVRQVGKQLGEADGVIVFDPSAFPKSGTESVGVARQWSGRQGKVDNCQVGIFMGYVSSREHALVDMRLYLPKEWTQDQQRRKKAGIPKDVRYRTRHQLCLEMLAQHAELLPHTWICGDDEMGRPYWFRRGLGELDERYLLAVPSNTLVRDLQIDPPEYSGRGRPPKRPWIRVDRWVAMLADEDWTRVDVRDGAKGPLVVEIVKRRVVGRTDKQQEGHEEVLLVFRYNSNCKPLVRKWGLAPSRSGFFRCLGFADGACPLFRTVNSAAPWKKGTGTERPRFSPNSGRYLLAASPHCPLPAYSLSYQDRNDRRVVKTDYCLSSASSDTELIEFGRAAKAEHRRDKSKTVELLTKEGNVP